MLDLIRESGFGAWLTILFVVAGIAATLTVGMHTGRPGSVAMCFAVAVLASGSMGVGAGQKMVDRAVMATTDVAQRVELLSIGTREASGNLLLSGMGALLLGAIGGVAAIMVMRKKG